MPRKLDKYTTSKEDSVKNQIETLRDDHEMSDEEIKNFYIKYIPHLYDILIKVLDAEIPKKINLKKMEEETKNLDKKIYKENEDWNKKRKEIKYLNVKKQNKKIISMNVVLIVDKSGKRFNIDTTLFVKSLPTRIQREIIKDLKRNLDTKLKKGKHNYDFESESD